jgi:hypothetical protein
VVPLTVNVAAVPVVTVTGASIWMCGRSHSHGTWWIRRDAVAHGIPEKTAIPWRSQDAYRDTSSRGKPQKHTAMARSYHGTAPGSSAQANSHTAVMRQHLARGAHSAPAAVIGEN